MIVVWIDLTVSHHLTLALTQILGRLAYSSLDLLQTRRSISLFRWVPQGRSWRRPCTWPRPAGLWGRAPGDPGPGPHRAGGRSLSGGGDHRAVASQPGDAGHAVQPAGVPLRSSRRAIKCMGAQPPVLRVVTAGALSVVLAPAENRLVEYFLAPSAPLC